MQNSCPDDGLLLELARAGVKIGEMPWHRLLRVRLLAALLIVVALVGCNYPTGPLMVLPSQDVEAEAPPGMSRLIFYNPEGAVRIATSTIHVELDGKRLPHPIRQGEYAQVFAAPGEHEVVLRHWDVIWFATGFTLEVPSGGRVVEVAKVPYGNSFRISEHSPETIEASYKVAER